MNLLERRRAMMASKRESQPKASFVLLKGESGASTRTGQASYQAQPGDRITVKWYGLSYAVNPRTYVVYMADGAKAVGISTNDYWWSYNIYRRSGSEGNYPDGQANIVIETGGTVWFSYDPSSKHGCYADRIEVTVM